MVHERTEMAARVASSSLIIAAIDVALAQIRLCSTMDQLDVITINRNLNLKPTD